MEHIQRKEKLLSSIGARAKGRPKKSPLTGDFQKTTKELSSEVNLKPSQYKKYHSLKIENIPKRVRNKLNNTKHSNSIEVLDALSKQHPKVQESIVSDLKNGMSLNEAIKTHRWTHNTDSGKILRCPDNFLELFGISPSSVMEFGSINEDSHPDLKHLHALINKVDNSSLKRIKSKRGSYHDKNSTFNLQHSLFVFKYYFRTGQRILDPFSGRGTRMGSAISCNCEYYGFDLATISLQKDVISKHLSGEQRKKVHLFNECGISMDSLKNKDSYFDGVFTCPPYFNRDNRPLEAFSDKSDDLSKMDIPSHLVKIRELFKNLNRVVKTSDWETKQISPVCFVVGSARNNTNKMGLVSMDRHYIEIAESEGFTLHDVFHTKNNHAHNALGVNNRYNCRYVSKSHETTLVFVKY